MDGSDFEKGLKPNLVLTISKLGSNFVRKTKLTINFGLKVFISWLDFATILGFNSQIYNKDYFS